MIIKKLELSNKVAIRELLIYIRVRIKKLES